MRRGIVHITVIIRFAAAAVMAALVDCVRRGSPRRTTRDDSTAPRRRAPGVTQPTSGADGSVDPRRRHRRG